MSSKEMPIQNKAKMKQERDSIRWILVIYDAIVYALCCFGIYLSGPKVSAALFQGIGIVFLIAGFGLYVGFRLLLKEYKQILRYGLVESYTKELLASMLASLIFVPAGILLRKTLGVGRMPAVTWVAFAVGYIFASLLIRIAYYHLYCFAQKDTKFARLIRSFIEVFCLTDFNSKVPGATLPMPWEHATEEVAPINELQQIAEKFAIRGEITKITQINKGYINRTYCVETLSARGHVHKYMMQRINTNVFPDVDALMDNFKLTTSHLHGKLQLPGYNVRGSVHSLRLTKDGNSYLRNASGCWRMLTYFDGVYSLDIPDCPETFYHAGYAFGKFMKEMADVDFASVKEVIPNFHNTASRYRDLEASISRDPKGRVEEVLPEIAFVRARADRYGMISEALQSGKIPTRICHNDCNLNNILFDEKTKLPVAIIDLDTVMPSSPLYDFGDSIRIGTNTAKDDEKDLSKVSCDLRLYELYARGYLEACGDMLTKEELQLLPYAALIITSEDGIRFLMDHIDGDTYYNIYYPGQNLDRSRTQLKLVEDMEKKLPEIKKILQKIYRELGLEA